MWNCLDWNILEWICEKNWRKGIYEDGEKNVKLFGLKYIRVNMWEKLKEGDIWGCEKNVKLFGLKYIRVNMWEKFMIVSI